MFCPIGYKSGKGKTILQHFEFLLGFLTNSGNDDQNIDQPIEFIQIIQETINTIIIELSLVVSSNDSTIPELQSKKKILVEKFFTILSQLIRSNANFIELIQNINISAFQQSNNYSIKRENFNFLSSFLFTNLIFHVFNSFNEEIEPLLEFLFLIQEIDHDFFASLFQLQYDSLTNYLHIILKTQYLSCDCPITNKFIFSLVILTENTDLLITDLKDLNDFNLLLQNYVLQKYQLLNSSDESEIRKYEEIILLHAEMNRQKLFLNELAGHNALISKSRLDTIDLFLNIAVKTNSTILEKIALKFITQSMKLDSSFDFNSFLCHNESAFDFIQHVYSNFLANPEDYQNDLSEETGLEIREILLDLISTISTSLDSLDDQLSDVFTDFVIFLFYSCSSSIFEPDLETNDSNDTSKLVKDRVISTIANLTSITGIITDKIVSADGFLEDIIDLIDESSFETKFYICIIFSNLLFESSQYFDSIMSRINIIEKMKPLIWSTIPSLHREVCKIFTNILMNVEDEESGLLISIELKEEGIIESLSMILSDITNTDLDDKIYIFELSEALNHYLF